MSKFPIFMNACLLVFLTGCLKNHDQDLSDENIVGADRDAHGCIGSAGYAWCEKTSQCERPWELAEEKGFPNTEEEFINYCVD